MITEDYCSYEVAMLLKEKGFDEPCTAVYEEEVLRINTLCYYHNSELSSYICAPTHQMTMKWLREKFNINPVPYALSLGWAFDVFDLSNRDITGCKKLFSMDLPSKSKCYKSYEEACESAIKYCLENFDLI